MAVMSNQIGKRDGLSLTQANSLAAFLRQRGHQCQVSRTSANITGEGDTYAVTFPDAAWPDVEEWERQNGL